MAGNGSNGIHKSCKGLADGCTEAGKSVKKGARTVVRNNKSKYAEPQPKPEIAVKHWTPFLFALLSIGTNPTLLRATIQLVSRGTVADDLFCGLSVISGLLALFGYMYAMKNYPKQSLVKLGKHMNFFHGLALLALAWPLISDWSMAMIDWLLHLIENPIAYLAFVFIFAFLAAVILPIPVELALAGYIVYLQNPETSFLGLGVFGAFMLISIVMGAAKGVGSWIVFVIGIKVENLVAGYMKWKWFRKMMYATHRFCVKFGYLAMYLVMCIPLMTDTVPLYIFSILNKDGDVFELNWFVMSNFWAGIARTLVVGITVMGGVLTYGYVA